MGMMFIHADSALEEKRVITMIQEADIEISISPEASVTSNSFSFTLDERTWTEDPVNIGHAIYVPDTEYGGFITQIIHNTGQRTVTLRGPTWRGILFQQAIEPPSGQSHFTLESTDANAVIQAVIGDRFGSLFDVSTVDTGVDISDSWRYQTCAAALHKVLAENGLRLQITYNNAEKAALLEARLVTLHADKIELSQDYGINFTSTSGRLETYNRCLALGSGELAARTVINVYRDSGVYYTTVPEGWDVDFERTTVFDYPNAESEADLIAAAIAHLKESEAENAITIDQIIASLEVDLGDIISVRDRLTGMTAQSPITSKLLTIRSGVLKIELKAG